MHVYFRSASGFKNSVPSEWRYIPPKYFIPNLSCNLQNSFTLGMDFSVNHQQLLEPLIANSQNSSLLSPMDDAGLLAEEEQFKETSLLIAG